MNISVEKIKLMTNNVISIQRAIKVNKIEAGHYNKLQIPWSFVSEHGSKPEVLLRFAQATTTLTMEK